MKCLGGGGNYVSSIFVLDNLKGKENDNFISEVGHKILIFAKNKKLLRENGGFSKTENIFGEIIDKKYSDLDEKGAYNTITFKKTGQSKFREDRPSMFYPILIKMKKFFLLPMMNMKKFIAKIPILLMMILLTN